MTVTALATEAVVFAAFYGVAFTAHAVHAKVTKRKEVAAEEKHGIAAVVAVAGHALAGAAHEYAVHFVVYSGHVLNGH